MFKKPFTSKTSSPLRNSALRALRLELSTLFSLPAEVCAQLLPDGVQSYKASTHINEPVTVYTAPGGDARFFRLGKKDDGELVPTCYALDLWPGMVPRLETAEAVVEHLVSGSALFSQGVSDSSIASLPDNIQVGSLVGIVVQHTTRLVAVGHLSVTKPQLLTQRQGAAVVTLHARGDHLWLAGSGEEGEPLAVASAAGAGSSGKRATKSSVKKEDASEVGQAGASVDAVADQLESTQLGDSAPQPTATTGKDLTPSEVDSILRNALLLSISQKLAKDNSAFPMSASTLYSSYILPFRPASLLENPADADIKKSSFKKLDKFVKLCDKAGVLKSKDMKGNLTIMSVNSAHPDVETVKGYKTLAQAQAQATKAAAAGGEGASASGAAGASSSASSSSSGGVLVRELYKASSSVLPLFQSSTYPRPSADLYTHNDLKQLLQLYITTNNLAHPRDQKYLRLDEPLSVSLLKKGEELDLLSKEQALERLKAGCTEHYEISRPGGGATEPVLRKGRPPVVKVAVKTVGKRMVTLITNHEPWDLFTSEQFAEELRLKSASSAAVQPIVGATKKGVAPKVEIMVQGSFEPLVRGMLVAKGVPTKYIEADLSKSKR